jgi:hypothetical protein
MVFRQKELAIDLFLHVKIFPIGRSTEHETLMVRNVDFLVDLLHNQWVRAYITMSLLYESSVFGNWRILSIKRGIMSNRVPHHRFHSDNILKQKLLGGRSMGLNKTRSVYPVTSLATLTVTQKPWCYVTVTYSESWTSFALSVHIYHAVIVH